MKRRVPGEVDDGDDGAQVLYVGRGVCDWCRRSLMVDEKVWERAGDVDKEGVNQVRMDHKCLVLSMNRCKNGLKLYGGNGNSRWRGKPLSFIENGGLTASSSRCLSSP